MKTKLLGREEKLRVYFGGYQRRGTFCTAQSRQVIRDVAVEGPLAERRTQGGPGGGGVDGRTHSPEGFNLTASLEPAPFPGKEGCKEGTWVATSATC